MVRPESGDGEIVPILGSVVPRADELIRIPATARRTPHTRRGRVIGPGQNQIRREKQKKNSKNYRSGVIHKITHSNSTLFQFYTLPILHSSNPTPFQSHTLPVLHSTLLQS